jgi:4-amino-4-deoxy-L-arabinose transferase-like glycosyltransferase
VTVLQSVPQPHTGVPRNDSWRWKRPGLLAVLIAAAFFASFVPVLSWMEFSGGMENFNVETALEMTRDGHWIVPTLDGEVRTKKPPLATWITALGIRSSKNLAFGARWPSLLMASLTLIGVYELGRLARGPTLGLVSACICGSMALFLKFAPQASYDTQFAFWVVVTNVFLARIVLRREWWTGSIGAGIALGMALMTKGPPALLLTIAPPLVLLGIERVESIRARRRIESRGFEVVARGTREGLGGAACGFADQETRPIREAASGGPRLRLLPLLVGLALCLAISLPWMIYILRHQPGRVSEWYNEVTLGTEAKFEKRIGGWFAYFAFVAWVLPWTIWFLGGIWLGFKRSSGRGIRLMLAWLLVPLLVLWFFPERRDRYVLPMLGQAAVLCGFALLEYLAFLKRVDVRPGLSSRWPLVVHWVGMIAFVLALGVGGAMGVKSLRTIGGGPWFSPPVAAGILLPCLVILSASVRIRDPGAVRLVGGTSVVILILAVAGWYGYSKSRDGHSEAKPLVDAVLSRYPDAIVYNAVNRPRRRDLPLEMTIYFNRVVPRARHVAALRPSDRAQAIIFPDGAERPPDGFVPVGRRFIKEEWWNAYVLPPRADARSARRND